MRADVKTELDRLVLDLHPDLTVRAVREDGAELRFEHKNGRVWVDLNGARAPGSRLKVRVHYGGTPHEAKRPPWQGGFTWSRTEDGSPWVATSCQGAGADIWWPCKDHPSDEPDHMSLRITVPAPLVCASNGRFLGVTEDEGWRTFHWVVSNPINNYTVALNIAPYRTVETVFHSITGEDVPATFWVLPENEEKARRLMPEILDHLRFLEVKFGPYPFRDEKYGVAETPFLGMEHQTIIAYGNEFQSNRLGYDWLHFHELAHEWWGNLITASNWADLWLHEAFATYAERLYVESRYGVEEYRRIMATTMKGLRNAVPVAPRGVLTSGEIYFDGRGNDIYYKGAAILHTLRYLMGDDDAFFECLRRFAYPTPEMEALQGGGQCRFVTTEQFIRLAEKHASRDLGWFFDVYLFQPELPELVTRDAGDRWEVRWKVPGGRPFPMPIDVQLGEHRMRIEMPDGVGQVPKLAESMQPDPDGWILKARPPRGR